MVRFGLPISGSSRVPARTARKCGRASDCVVTGVPHEGQKPRWVGCRWLRPRIVRSRATLRYALSRSERLTFTVPPPAPSILAVAAPTYPRRASVPLRCGSALPRVAPPPPLPRAPTHRAESPPRVAPPRRTFPHKQPPVIGHGVTPANAVSVAVLRMLPWRAGPSPLSAGSRARGLWPVLPGAARYSSKSKRLLP